jgi:hypothetical protein
MCTNDGDMVRAPGYRITYQAPWLRHFTAEFEPNAPPAWQRDVPDYRLQSTATANAEQISRMRSSPNLPSRSVSVPTETLSTESRFTADRTGIGSSPGSSCTSLASPRIVVVHGAINAFRSLGIATSLERTTTGRREISGSSHHHTSPLAGRPFTTKPQPREMTPSRPIRPTHPGDARHKRRMRHRFRPLDAGTPTR